MKKKSKKLMLAKETLRSLVESKLSLAQGGATLDGPCPDSLIQDCFCPYPPYSSEGGTR